MPNLPTEATGLDEAHQKLERLTGLLSERGRVLVPTLASARTFALWILMLTLQPSTSQEAFETRLNLAYAGTDNPRQRLDLYLPTKRDRRLLPVVVFIHGGGWQVGGKGSGRQQTAVEYASTGLYAAASVGYRLTDEARWPAQIHDCKAAIRWLRANAAKQGLDPERIGVMGTSAGGHLSAMLGTTAGDDALEGTLGSHLDVSSRVTCVVDFFGPTELLTLGTWHDNPQSPESKLVGGTLQETKEVARQASPLTHVSKGDAPCLIIHGSKDTVVPFAQSVKFHAALQAAGVESALLEMPGAGHNEPYASGQFDEQVLRFFERHLRGRAAERRGSALPSGGPVAARHASEAGASGIRGSFRTQGPLRGHSGNPRYFADGSGRTKSGVRCPEGVAPPWNRHRVLPFAGGSLQGFPFRPFAPQRAFFLSKTFRSWGCLALVADPGWRVDTWHDDRNVLRGGHDPGGPCLGAHPERARMPCDVRKRSWPKDSLTGFAWSGWG